MYVIENTMYVCYLQHRRSDSVALHERAACNVADAGAAAGSNV